MAYFPFFIELADKRGLVAGGGAIAERKVERLLPYGPSLTVVAPRIGDGIRRHGGLTLLERPFSPEDLDGCHFAVAATNRRDVNAQIAGLCRARGIPVNAVDDAQSCTFLFPALVRRGALSVGISTGGSSPAAAAYIKEQIEGILPSDFDDILAFLYAQRKRVHALLPDEQARARLMKALLAACLSRGGPLSADETEQYMQQVLGELCR